MSKNSGFFEMSESPFKVYESYDVDYETPKTSHRVVKKSLTSLENRDIKIKMWSELFKSKYTNQVSTQSAKTPQTRKLDWSEPLAPIKPRRSINKTELKPKKLVFKDADDYESNIVSLLSPLTLKKPEKIVVKTDEESASRVATKRTDRPRVRRQPVSDDKENRVENLRKKAPINPPKPQSTQPKNSNDKTGLKHLRI